ncbi:MAG: class I adenylate-forming enzyme family protein [Acidimicrobiia bacterium]
MWGRLEFLRDRALTLATFAERLARVHGIQPLVEEHGDGGLLRLGYDDAASIVARWAGGLRGRVARGDRVVVALPNGYSVFLLVQAVTRVGAVAVPVNPQMRPQEIDHVVADSGAEFVVRDTDELEGGEPAASASVEPGDVAALLYTSGTTGRPKGAELTHRALLKGVTKAALYPSRLRRDEAVSGMPVAHIAGFSLLLQLAAFGIPVYLLPRFRPDIALDAIEQRRATIFVGVPAMYRMMEDAGAETRDLSSVRLWASGADAMPHGLARRFQKRGATAQVPIMRRPVGEAAFIDGYGMVELGGGAAVKLLPPGLPLPITGAVGLPLPGYRMKIVDETGRVVPRGQVGELAVRGPGVMRGYHGHEEETRHTLSDDGWLRTGDLARRGRLGLIEFAGRKKDVIKHGGYSVFAAEVEGVLDEHPAILESAVVGLPDERKGEVPAAAVRCRTGASTSESELLAWAADRLAEYKTPQRIVFVDAMPRTATDKVRKSEITQLLTAQYPVDREPLSGC